MYEHKRAFRDILWKKNLFSEIYSGNGFLTDFHTGDRRYLSPL